MATAKGSRQKLCKLCTEINFRDLFRQRARELNRRTKRQEIGDLFNSVKNQSSCSCCRFLLEACQLGRTQDDTCFHTLAGAKDNKIYLSDDPNGKPWYYKAGIEANLPGIPYFWMQFGPLSETGEPHICISLEHSNISTNDALDFNSSALPRIRCSVEVVDGSINIDIVQAWITTCNGHGAKCGRPIAQGYVYYLIDVHTRSIVRVSSGYTYVALSYVWGKEAQTLYQREWNEEDIDNHRDILTGWRVPNPAAQTIEDAMIFVKNLGETYLWTDLYCIDQNDEAVKAEQIMHMDKIYASSYLTIVALDGENADWGLPGVSRPLQDARQPILTLGKDQVTATYVFSIHDHLGESVWDSRAWTLQERLISSRCIIFAKSSISMRCQQEFFHDSMKITATDTKSRVPTKLDKEIYWEDGSTININETEWDFKHYDALVSTYTGRSLTNQSDALNACRGVLNVISKNTNQTFIFGLPVGDIHRALLWKPHHDNTVTRRENFPSWSWVGWQGRTEYAYWIVDMADYVEEATHRPRKRVRVQKAFDMQPEISADISYIPQMERDSGLIKISSEVANFNICRRRAHGEMHIGLKATSLQPSHAVGDHWTLVANGMDTRKLQDIASEREVFERVDFFFRIHPNYRSILESFEPGRRPAKFLLIQKWPYIRDSKISKKNTKKYGERITDQRKIKR